MSYLNYYHTEKAIPQIIDLLSKEGIEITSNNIKSWSTPVMSYSDVTRGIDYIKRIEGNTLVYTNKVQNKEDMSKQSDINIIDVDDLIRLSIKHKNFTLCDLLQKN